MVQLIFLFILCAILFLFRKPIKRTFKIGDAVDERDDKRTNKIANKIRKQK